MVIGAGIRGQGGAVLRFRSADLLDWTYEGVAAERGRPRFAAHARARVGVPAALRARRPARAAPRRPGSGAAARRCTRSLRRRLRGRPLPARARRALRPRRRLLRARDDARPAWPPPRLGLVVGGARRGRRDRAGLGGSSHPAASAGSAPGREARDRARVRARGAPGSPRGHRRAGGSTASSSRRRAAIGSSWPRRWRRATLRRSGCSCAPPPAARSGRSSSGIARAGRLSVDRSRSSLDPRAAGGRHSGVLDLGDDDLEPPRLRRRQHRRGLRQRPLRAHRADLSRPRDDSTGRPCRPSAVPRWSAASTCGSSARSSTISSGFLMDDQRFADVAEVVTDLEHAYVYEHGWQSWSPTGLYPALATSPRPRRPVWQTNSYRPERPAPEQGFQAEGLLAVLPADGPGAPLGRARPNARACRRSGRPRRTAGVVVSADGPVEELSHDGSLDEALGAWAETLAARAGVAPTRTLEPAWCSWYAYWAKVTEADVVANLAAIDRLELPVGIVQLDDGYAAEHGDWLELNDALHLVARARGPHPGDRPARRHLDRSVPGREPQPRRARAPGLARRRHARRPRLGAADSHSRRHPPGGCRAPDRRLPGPGGRRLRLLQARLPLRGRDGGTASRGHRPDRGVPPRTRAHPRGSGP